MDANSWCYYKGLTSDRLKNMDEIMLKWMKSKNCSTSENFCISESSVTKFHRVPVQNISVFRDELNFFPASYLERKSCVFFQCSDGMTIETKLKILK